MKGGAAEIRAAVVAEAMTWVGTPYHHHARVKGAGVDCAQILIAVFCDALKIVAPVDPGFYSRQWHLHRSEELYRRWLQEAGARRTSTIQAGDVALFKYGRTFSHGAICVNAEGGEFVHAYIRLGVVRTRTSEAPLEGREVEHWSVIE